MSTKKLLLLGTVFVLIVSLLACSTGHQPPTKEWLLESTTNPTNVPTSVILPTASLASQETDCQELSIDNQLSAEGFLLVKDNHNDFDVVDLRNMKVERFLKGPAQFSFSPGAQALAYTILDAPDQILVVKSASKSISIPWDKNWVSLARWVDNENIQINENTDSLTSQIIFNPYKNSSKRLVPNFTDIYNLDAKVNWDGLSLVSYSSNLRFAVYPRLHDNLSLVVVPTQENGLVVSLSPISGVTHPLTNFTKSFDYPLIKFYRWSTNYQNIAFWFTKDSRKKMPAYLGLTNTQDQITALTCIKTKNIYSATPPVWSPDGYYLTVIADFDDKIKNLIIVDLSNSRYRILNFQTGLTPIGWINFKP